jgi:hypothetical protein
MSHPSRMPSRASQDRKASDSQRSSIARVIPEKPAIHWPALLSYLDVERDLMKEISLTRGLVALVDDEDFESLSQHKWCSDGNGYAGRHIQHPTKPGRRIFLYMHRAIVGLEVGDKRKGDHRDGNGLNNQRYNLRPATHAENMCNARMRKDNTSGFKGVSWDKYTGRWQAAIHVSNKRIHLGRHDTPEGAHAAYCEASKKYHGEFGRAA